MEMKTQADHYRYFIDKYKPGESLYVGWSTKEKQKRCFLELSQVGALQWFTAGKTILDVGCGIGDFLFYTGNNDYTGIDINKHYIDEAKKRYPDKNFEVCDLRDYGKHHDYVIASGPFNLKVSYQILYIMEAIRKMVWIANKAVAFNLLSDLSGSNLVDGDLYYYDPTEILRFCLSQGYKTTLIHDYALNDFTVIIKKGDLE